MNQSVFSPARMVKPPSRPASKSAGVLIHLKSPGIPGSVMPAIVYTFLGVRGMAVSGPCAARAKFTPIPVGVMTA